MRAFFEEFPQAGQAAELLEYTNAEWVMHRHAEASNMAADIIEEVLILAEKSPQAGMIELQTKMKHLFE